VEPDQVAGVFGRLPMQRWDDTEAAATSIPTPPTTRRSASRPPPGAAARTVMGGRQVAPFATYGPDGPLAQVFASRGRSFAASQTHWYRLAEDGTVVAFGPNSATVRDVAAGGRLLVDVELGPRHRLYALSQGVFPPGSPEGSPAEPNTGALAKANRDGTLTVVIDRLHQPTSLEFLGSTAYVLTLGGEVWKLKGVSAPPHRTSG
jgi:hypothetical protein